MTLHPRLLLAGFLLWLAGTAAVRVAGQRILRPDNWTSIAILFAISLPVMIWVVQRLCAAHRLPYDRWPAGAASVALPSLLIDPFSTLLFPSLFPNIEPGAAPLFGAWILWCCAGAILGGVIRGGGR